jgi:hypothetical protein
MERLKDDFIVREPKRNVLSEMDGSLAQVHDSSAATKPVDALQPSVVSREKEAEPRPKDEQTRLPFQQGI